MKYLTVLMLGLLTSCTYAITMVHTEGQATDVVDETATNTPSTSVSIPVSATGIPSLPGLAAPITRVTK